MFKSQSKYKLFTYSILFEDIINPFIELISDILSIAKEDNWGIITAIDFSKINKSLAGEIQALECKNRSFSQDKKLFIRNKKVLTEELKKRQEVIENDVERLKKWGNESINEYFFNEIFSLDNLSKYERSRIFLLDRANRFIIAEGDSISDVIVKVLSKSSLISRLISCVKNNGNVNFKKLINFDGENLYRPYVNIEEFCSLLCPAINLSFLQESLTKIPAENTDIWINKEFFKKYSLSDVGEFSKNENVYIIKNEDMPIGVNVGDVCFVYESNPASLIKTKNLLDYYWCLLKNNIYRLPEQNDNYKSDLVKEFNNQSKKESFTCLLSGLQKNLYIEGDEVPDDFRQFFEGNFVINELKHLLGYELYLPYTSEPGSSLIGIYHTDKKPSETHYNLIHWISNHTDKNHINEFSKEKPVSKTKKLIQVLKPEVSFYFRHKYFEDFFEEILKELDMQYVSNYKITYRSNGQGAEFDFIIKTTRKIYVIELKTKLRNEDILKYEEKCKKVIAEMPLIEDDLEFLIIGAFSDKNCVTYKYYIEKGKTIHPGYNTERDGFYTIPYWFSFPIASSNKKLTCIAEPSYEKLKSIISQICI